MFAGLAVLWSLQGESSLLMRLGGPGVTPLAAGVDLCKLCAFTLPDHGCFLFLLYCQGHSSRSGEQYVVRELGRKFCRPPAPPFQSSHHLHHLHVSWVIVWWRELVEGRDGRRREGSLCLNSCCLSLALSGNSPWSPVGRDRLAWGRPTLDSGELGVWSLSRSGWKCVSCWMCVSHWECPWPSCRQLLCANCLLCCGEWACKPAREKASQH